MVSKFSKLYNSKLLRGMVAYSISWQTSSLVEQTIRGLTWNTYEWEESFRFGFYGGCVVAPILHYWVIFLNQLCPENSLKSSIAKSAVEQISFSPVANCMFFIGMNLLEGNGLDKGIAEMKLKFLQTYLTGLTYWFTIKIVLYHFAPPKKLLPLKALCAFVWSLYLAVMKHKSE